MRIPLDLPACQEVGSKAQEAEALAFLSMEEYISFSAHSGITDIFSLLNKDVHSLDL